MNVWFRHAQAIAWFEKFGFHIPHSLDFGTKCNLTCFDIVERPCRSLDMEKWNFNFRLCILQCRQALKIYREQEDRAFVSRMRVQGFESFNAGLCCNVWLS